MKAQTIDGWFPVFLFSLSLLRNTASAIKGEVRNGGYRLPRDNYSRRIVTEVYGPRLQFPLEDVERLGIFISCERLL